jgi:hypothetical protein
MIRAVSFCWPRMTDQSYLSDANILAARQLVDIPQFSPTLRLRKKP